MRIILRISSRAQLVDPRRPLLRNLPTSRNPAARVARPSVITPTRCCLCTNQPVSPAQFRYRTATPSSRRRVDGVKAPQNLIHALIPARRRRGGELDLVVRVLDGIVGGQLLPVQRLADGTTPRHDLAGVVPWGRRFRGSRLDPGVAGRGSTRDRPFHPRFCRKHGLHLCGNQPVCRVHRQFFTKSPHGDGAAVLARSSGEEPASPRHRAGVASMAWRVTNAP